MPRYDYRCGKGHVFEFERPFGSNKKPRTCPTCGSKKLEKILTPPNVQFKGSGWYKTDSAASTKVESKKAVPKKGEESVAAVKENKGTSKTVSSPASEKGV
jgi:putative FmdB family regulatory protein